MIAYRVVKSKDTLAGGRVICRELGAAEYYGDYIDALISLVAYYPIHIGNFAAGDRTEVYQDEWITAANGQSQTRINATITQITIKPCTRNA